MQTEERALRDALKTYWGYDDFRPLQREAMLAAMRGEDTVIVLPTGGGKSLCYQAPAVCRDGLVIVVSPLISLMKDQVDAARACGIAAAFLNSTQGFDERRDVLHDLRSGKLKLLYVAPERATLDDFPTQLAGAEVAFIAIDEAHCVSMWGHDFRPHYRELKVLREWFPKVAMHAFTATATPRVQDDIVNQLKLRNPTRLVGQFDRPNLMYRVERRERILSQIETVLARHKGESGIVYCITRKEVEERAAELAARGHKVRPYHAGLDDNTRRRNQEAFIDDDVDIVVATVAFGMGIDKPNVRFVIHTGMPASIENYQQETGRGGRDGLEAECCLFFGGDDLIKWEFMVRDQPEALKKVSLNSLRLMSDFCGGAVCRHRALVQHFGQDLDDDCQTACDICLGEREPVDEPLVLAQKILSSVYRQEQRFGIEYTAMVLKGSKEQRILANGHEKLSTYGLLKDESKPVIMDWIGQLVGQGFLQKVGEYGVLNITPTGWKVLKGEAQPRLLRPRKETRKDFVDEPAKKSKEPAPESWEGVDRDLFEKLRGVRAGLAHARGVPPYIIFGDAALRDMARRRPSTPDGFLLVTGVGKQKCADFGDEFLAAIAVHCETTGAARDITPGPTKSPPRESPKELRSTVEPAFPLFDAGASVDEVAAKLGRARSTAMGYLVDYLRVKKISDPSRWVAADVVQRVEQALATLGPGPLKPLFMHLEEKIDYDTLKIVSICYQNRLE